MKKFLFLCCAMLCCISASAQIGFTVSASTVTSDQEVTITSTGENHAIASGNKYITSVGPFSVVSANPSTYLSGQSILWTSVTYSTSTAPTVIKVKPKNTSSVPVTVTYKFRVDTYDNWGFVTIAPYDYQFTLTVNPAPTVYYNTLQSISFTRNDCGAGYSGSSVPVSVSANTYTGTSVADANQKAINYINATGQAYANAHGTCATIYNSIAYTSSFTRNNCDSHSDAGPAVSYTLPAGAKTSIISQADADAQALVVFNTNGQNSANATGTCIIRNKTFITYSNQAFTGSRISRVRIYNSSNTLVYDFNESQLLAGPEIDLGIYKFVVTTVGPISNVVAPNTGWGSFDITLSNTGTGYYAVENTGGTSYTVNSVDTSNSHELVLGIYKTF